MFGEKREKSLRAEVPGGPWGGCGEESEAADRSRWSQRAASSGLRSPCEAS